MFCRYGVPRTDAEKFEAVMHQSAPELFKHHPDLLHHLVTTINPNKLMQEGLLHLQSCYNIVFKTVLKNILNFTLSSYFYYLILIYKLVFTGFYN